MLEVLDPEQNNTFRDNYLAVPFDLSRVVFIATANMLDTIPGPAARPHGDHQLCRLHGGREAADRPALSGAPPDGGQRAEGRSRSRSPTTRSRDIIERYTREAGVRSLEREIGRVLRQAAVRIAEGEAGPMRIDDGDLVAILGPPQIRERGRDAHQRARAWRRGLPGRRSAATSCSSRRPRTPGGGRLILTGQLGEVMRESAQAALSIVKNRAASFGIDPDAVREERHPRPCAGGRDAEGWAERGRGDVHGAGLAHDRAAPCAAIPP